MSLDVSKIHRPINQLIVDRTAQKRNNWHTLIFVFLQWNSNPLTNIMIDSLPTELKRFLESSYMSHLAGRQSQVASFPAIFRVIFDADPSQLYSYSWSRRHRRHCLRLGSIIDVESTK